MTQTEVIDSLKKHFNKENECVYKDLSNSTTEYIVVWIRREFLSGTKCIDIAIPVEGMNIKNINCLIKALEEKFI